MQGRPRAIGAVSALVGATAALWANACAQTLRLSSGVEYTTGAYGSHRDTDILIASVAARYSVDAWAFGLTIPYVRVEGPGAPLDPFAVSIFAVDLPPGAETTGTPRLLLPSDPGFRFPHLSPVSKGVGDVTASASRSFELARDRLFLDTTAIVKLPTGDPDRLIGTGSADLTLRGDLVHEARGLGLFAGGGRTFTGRTERFSLQDRWDFSAGFYKPVGRRFTFGALYEWRQPIVVDSAEVSEVTTYASVQISRDLSLLGYVVAGLSDGSPDVGAGLRLSVDFDMSRPKRP